MGHILILNALSLNCWTILTYLHGEEVTNYIKFYSFRPIFGHEDGDCGHIFQSLAAIYLYIYQVLKCNVLIFLTGKKNKSEIDK